MRHARRLRRPRRRRRRPLPAAPHAARPPRRPPRRRRARAATPRAAAAPPPPAARAARPPRARRRPDDVPPEPAAAGASPPARAAVPAAPAGASRGRPRSYEQLVAEANRALENGNTAKAQKFVDEALRLQPSGVAAVTSSAYLLLDKQKPLAAVGEFKRALNISPNFPQALFGARRGVPIRGRPRAGDRRVQAVPRGRARRRRRARRAPPDSRAREPAGASEPLGDRERSRAGQRRRRRCPTPAPAAAELNAVRRAFGTAQLAAGIDASTRSASMSTISTIDCTGAAPSTCPANAAGASPLGCESW